MACLNPTYSNCIEFSADLTAKLSALGYTATNLEQFLLIVAEKGVAKLSDQVYALQQTVNSISTSTLKANAKSFGLKSGSTDIVKLNNRSVDYSLIGTTLNYDFSGLRSDLPSDIAYLSARADAVDLNGRKTSIKGSNNSLTIALPANVTFSVDLRSPNGNLTLEKSVYLESDVEKSTTLNVRDFTSAPADQTVQESLEMLSAEVSLLKQRL